MDNRKNKHIYWNPYFGGFLLGIVIIFSFYMTGRGLGATGAIKSSVVAVVDTVAPTQVKKFATGSGRADKEKMHESFKEENSVNLQHMISPNRKNIGNPVSDIVDAYYICKYGFTSYKTSQLPQ